ncbi:MAG: hypothetical protein JW760_01215 [Spirochaetales bacterium]|nr:hypothetical protein [Spirochaetales bacterium]
MIRYAVKGNSTVKTWLEITAEKEDGFDVRITSEYEDYSKTLDEYMSRELFDTCLRTGYLIKTDMATELLSAAS